MKRIYLLLLIMLVVLLLPSRWVSLSAPATSGSWLLRSRQQQQAQEPAVPLVALEELNAVPLAEPQALGSDPRAWRVRLADANLRHQEIFPGVDLVFAGSKQKLEAVLIVKAGADLANVHFDFPQAEIVTADAQGTIWIVSPDGDLGLLTPRLTRQNEMVKGGFTVTGSRVALRVEGHDATPPLLVRFDVVFPTRPVNLLDQILFRVLKPEERAANGQALAPSSPSAPSAITSVTKTVSPTGNANLGDTLMYTVTINNGPAAASGVTFTDTIDANTTLVGGSLNASPIATDDTYTASGNIPIAPASGLLTNDIDPETNTNAGLTVTQVQGVAGNVGNATNTTATGRLGVFGSVTVQSNGSFTYTPPPGFTGNDTFTYRVAEAGGKFNDATVTITISNAVWFIDNTSAAANSRGTFTEPFKTIAEFNTANTGAAPNPQPGHFIALRRGSGTYAEADGLNLRNNQKLIGEAVAFNTEFTADANSSAAYTTFAVGTMAAPIISASAGNGVDLASGNTLRGFTIGNTTDSDIAGTSFGVLSISAVTLNGTGRALNLNTGSFASGSSITSITSTSSIGQGVNLQTISGTNSLTVSSATISGSTTSGIDIGGSSAPITFTTVTIDNTGGAGIVLTNNTGVINVNGGTVGATNDPTGNVVDIDQGNANVTIAAALTKNNMVTGGRIVEVTARTGGAVDISGNLTCTQACTGINVASNNSGSITFSGGTKTLNTGANTAVTLSGGTSTTTFSNGGLDIDTTTGTGFDSTSSAVNISGANNTITSTSGRALNISGSLVDITLATVSSTNSGTTGVSLDVAGTLTIGTTSVTNSTGIGISVNTSGPGTLNFGNTTVAGTGGTASGIDINGSSTAVTFTSVTIDNTGGAGIALTNNTGIIMVNGGTVGATNDPAGNVVDIDQGNANVTIAAALTKNTGAARIVEVTNRTGGTIDISGNLSCTSACTGINVANNTSGVPTITFSGGTKTLNTAANAAVTLATNTGATINFTNGGLDIDTTSGTGFNATGGAAGINVTGSNNTIDSTTGTALNVANTTIGAGGLTFRSISANGATNGIVLNTTGSGGLTVTGTGSAGTGGTIQNGATGISLTNTQNVSLSRMQLNGFTDFAIRGSSVAGFTLADSTINGTNGNAVNEGSIRFTEVTGTVALTNVDVGGGAEDNVRILNAIGTLNLTVSGSTFRPNSSALGSDGLNVEMLNAAAATTSTLLVSNCTFTGARGDHLQFIQASLGGTMNATVKDSSFSNSGSQPGVVSGGLVVPISATRGTLTFDINNNTFRDATGAALTVDGGGIGPGAVTPLIQGHIRNNTVGVQAVANSGSNSASGIGVVNSGGGTFKVVVDNNRVYQYNNHGILTQAGQDLGNAADFNVTVTNNTVSNPGNLNSDFNGFHLNNGTVPVGDAGDPAGDNFTSCVDLRSNTLTGSGNGVTPPNNQQFRLRQRQATTVRLPGYGGANNNDAAVVTFLQGQNTVTAGNGAASNTVPTGGGFIGGAACSQPPAPSSFAPIEPVSSSLQEQNGDQAQRLNSSRELFASLQESDPALGLLDRPQTPADYFRFSAQPVAAATTAVTAPPTTSAISSGGQFSGQSLRPVWSAFTTALSYLNPLNLFEQPATAAETPNHRPALKRNAQDRPTRKTTERQTLPERQSQRPPTRVLLSPTSGETVMVGPFNLPANESVTIMFSVTINNPPTAGTTQVCNQGSVTPGPILTDGDAGTAGAQQTCTTLNLPDLAVTKSDLPDPVTAGNNLTYTINLANNGTLAASTVTLTDLLPANTTFVSAAVTTGTGWSTSAPSVGGTGSVVFSKGTVAPAETAVFTIVVKVNSNTANGTVITNNAVAATTTYEGNTANNTGTATSTVNTQADLAVTKTGSPTPNVFAGNNITYTVTLANNGPSDAQTVTLTDAVPANTTFVSAMVTSGTGWSLSAPAVGATGNVVFSKATVAASETATYQIVVAVGVSTPDATVISNTATAASATTDPTPGNNSATAMTTVQAAADLAVTKSDSPDPVLAGNNITYTVNFVNNGPTPAGTVTVTDAVPANTTFVSASVTTGSGWTPTTPSVGGTGNVVFSKASVANAETAVFSIVVKVNSSTASGATITNTATAASATGDPTPANNSATAMTTVNTQADLAVTKTDSPDPVSAGNNITYTINFTNNGPSDASTVTVTDAVPSGTTFVSATVTTGAGWSTSAPSVGGTGNVVFSKAAVTAGESAVFTIIVKVPANTANATVITNTATAAATTTDPTPGNNSATAMTTVNTQADLSVTKTDSPDPVIAGNNITYTINFTNNGPSDASTVTVTDAVPAGATFVSASVTTGAGWSTSAPAVGATGNVVFSKATVAAAETAVFSIVVKVNSSATGSISNTATAATTTTDPTPGNNSATAMTTVNTQADLAVTKGDAPDPVFVGSNITYTVNFTNNGPSDASTVTVTDAVPANTTFVSATVTTGSGWSTNAPAVGATGNVVFSKASVASAETAVFTIVVNVNVSTPHNTTITNTATAASATTDPTPGNNSATATTTAQASADLAVTKGDAPDPVIAGANLTYTINFSNNGPTAAGVVTVTDAVPANTTFVSATVTTGTGWSTSAPAVGATGNVVFSKASVASAETAVFTIVVKVNANTANGATISNTATAASTTGDPTPGNNSATATTTVNTQADLSVTKTDSPDPVIAGNNLTYTINFSNNGPSAASTVTVTDAVPAGTTFVSASVTTGAGWSTSAPAVGATGNVVFSKATVAAAETAVFSIVVKVNSSATGSISNTATAASTTTDPTPANNSATATTTVNTQADLAVTKSDAPDPVTAGQNITYTINFTNNGPSDASTVTVTDAVPANTTFVSATVTTGTGWSTSAPAVGATGNVVFSKASVANAQTAVFSVVVKVNNGFSGTVTNTATAASATTDPTPGNNSATATTTAFATPTIAKAFSPTSVVAGSNTTITLTLSNSNASQLTNASFSDTLTNMSAVGGMAGGSCVGASSNVFAANATGALNFSGITIPANGSCTVSFSVKANAAGTLPNTTAGVTTAQTTVAGAPSNTANLTVTCAVIDLTPKPIGPVGGSAYVLPTTTVGANYTATNTVITAAPAGGNYTFTVIAAPNLLPPGLSLSPSPNSVQIVGTPTTAGIYVFRIQAQGFGTCTGLRLYSIRVNATSFAARAVRNDFDGDGKSDPALWRSDLGEWRIVLSSTGELQTVPLVEPSEPDGKKEEYLPAAADFDGDQKTDAAVWRVRDGRWLIKRSTDGELVKAQFGQAGDAPVPADYDGDGRGDFALWRNATGSWHILRSSEQTEQSFSFGAPGDAPVAGDYDGDGLLDLAVFRASEGRWLLRYTATGVTSEERFGQVGDWPLAADYDGDGLTDLAVWRQADGFGYVRRSLDQETQRVPWGRLQLGELAVSGDYDGDARADLAIWRVAKAAWDILLNQ